MRNFARCEFTKNLAILLVVFMLSLFANNDFIQSTITFFLQKVKTTTLFVKHTIETTAVYLQYQKQINYANN